MADGVFNVALGKAAYYASQAGTGNAALIVVLLKAAETADTLNNYTTLGAILGAAGNTEADFTNYARKTVTSVTNTVNNTTNTATSDFPDQTWTSAGGTTNNTLVRALICYDADTTTGTDTNIIPLTYHDFTPTTTGADLVMQLDPAGFYGAA